MCISLRIVAYKVSLLLSKVQVLIAVLLDIESMLYLPSTLSSSTHIEMVSWFYKCLKNDFAKKMVTSGGKTTSL